MLRISPFLAVLMILAGCDHQPAFDTNTTRRSLVSDAENAAIAHFGPNSGVKAQLVTTNPSEQNKLVCGRTDSGEEWAFSRRSDGRMVLSTRADTDFTVYIIPCNDASQLTRLS